LASLLTASTYRSRLLGVSKVVDLPNNVILVGTGNNVRATGEIVKRSVPICLQPPTDAPEQRAEFVHPNLWSYIRERRRHVLACLLGMVKAWLKAGRPRGAVPMGGFDEWAAVIGGVMHMFGFTHWLGNVSAWRAHADVRRSDLRALVEEWYRRHGTAPRGVKEILAIAQQFELFPDVIGVREGKALETAFGMRVLARNVDTPVGQWLIRRNSVSRPALYSLRLLEGSNK
jgi:putative DNA primase/helicase